MLDYYSEAMDPQVYEAEYQNLRYRLLKLQFGFARAGCQGLVLLEGWDAAGKGGLIRRIAWSTDPRTLKVWRYNGEPEDPGKPWLDRYRIHLPEAGQIAVFDHAWYRRVLSDRVEGTVSEAEWQAAYSEINDFEAALKDEGIRLAKIFLDISPETQLKRFRDRLADPDKRWKLSPADVRHRQAWDAYAAAFADMIAKTDTPHAPWDRIDANDKQASRLVGMEAIIDRLRDGLDLSPVEVPEDIVDYLCGDKA